jgi:probable addiction module antidote protein
MMTFDVLDLAEDLESEKEMVGFMALCADDPNPRVLRDAIDAVVRARGMEKLAAESGLDDESLSKSIPRNLHARYDLIQRVMDALGIKEPFAVP